MNRKFKTTAFIWNISLCNIINAFIVTFNQFNVSLVNKNKTLTNAKPLNDSVCQNSETCINFNDECSQYWQDCWGGAVQNYNFKNNLMYLKPITFHAVLILNISNSSFILMVLNRSRDNNFRNCSIWRQLNTECKMPATEQRLTGNPGGPGGPNGPEAPLIPYSLKSRR